MAPPARLASAAGRAMRALVEVERFAGTAPEVAVFVPPKVL
jgi:hypothetical protein